MGKKSNFSVDKLYNGDKKKFPDASGNSLAKRFF